MLWWVIRKRVCVSQVLWAELPRGRGFLNEKKNSSSCVRMAAILGLHKQSRYSQGGRGKRRKGGGRKKAFLLEENRVPISSLLLLFQLVLLLLVLLPIHSHKDRHFKQFPPSFMRIGKGEAPVLLFWDAEEDLPDAAPSL